MVEVIIKPVVSLLFAGQDCGPIGHLIQLRIYILIHASGGAIQFLTSEHSFDVNEVGKAIAPVIANIIFYWLVSNIQHRALPFQQRDSFFNLQDG